MQSEKLVISFADLKISFCFPMKVVLPKELTMFGCVEGGEPDISYEISILNEPLQILGEDFTKAGGTQVYKTSEGWLRVFSGLVDSDGCQVACLNSWDNKKNRLYYPARKWEHYAKEIHLLHLIGVERLLLSKQAMILHSAVVKLNRQAVLFSGPAFVGKSTQASLWERYLGADILNGDRCVIRKIGETFYGCGSPWAGTSGIYRREMAPIKGIFILRQAKKNSVRRMTADAFVKIYEQSIVNAWDREFVEKISELIANLLTEVPVYELACRPDEDAVRLAYHTLFEGGV